VKKPATATSRKRRTLRWLAAGALLVGAALGTLVVMTRQDAGPVPAAPTLSRLEQEAEARFAGSKPYITLPNGKRVPPVNAAHELQMKVNAYKGLLARESEDHDPTFPLKAEAELARRQPMRAAIEWNDVTGNREMDFNIEDSSTCALGSQTELTVAMEDIAHYPCLTQGGNFWEAGTKLSVHLTPITKEDPLWPGLLATTKRAMAAEAHLAKLDAAKGS